MAGCNKKKRKARLAGVEKTMLHAETKQARHKKYGHSYTRSDKTGPAWPKDASDPNTKCRTFEDEYQSFRKTRGRKGWSTNPDKRGYENPVYLKRNSIFNVQRIPMTELMEKAILAHESGREF
jgi:hypothetical protein